MKLKSLVILGFTVTVVSALIGGSHAAAISGADFKAGNIIDDAIFYNSKSMTATQVQTFLNSKVKTCDTDGSQLYGSTGMTVKEYWTPRGEPAPYTCLKDYKQKTPAMSGESGICAYIPAYTSRTAAQIITDIARACTISPKVLIILLEKEQSLVTDTSPLKNLQYGHATGFACPDTAPCDPHYGGFFYQVYYAARQFQLYRANPDNYNYVAGQSNKIYYNPDFSCGYSWVYIENQATASLYDYTPYQPNAATLKVGLGQTAPCGAYGNKNFWWIFTAWFGSTHYAVQGSIGKYYNSGDVAVTLGNPIENESKTANGGYKQCFEHGCIVGSSDTGYWTVKGSIGTYYWKIKGPSGRMGLPLANEVNAGNSMYYQKYQGGYIAGRRDTGYWDVKGSIAKAYASSSISVLGVPLQSEVKVSDTAYKQCFDNGCIVGSHDTGYWPTKGSIGDYYWDNGGVTGSLGLPLASEVKYGDNGVYYQKYQKGYILGQHSTGYWSVKGSIRAAYDALGAYKSSLGIPLSDEQKSDDGVYTQQYQNGYIVGKSGGYYESSGKIRDYWVSLGSWTGGMGLITGPIKVGELNMSYQHYEKGVLILNPNTNQVWESKGSIRAIWAKLGYQTGKLGFPTGPEVNTDGIWSQTYEHGIIETKDGKEYKVTYTP